MARLPLLALLLTTSQPALAAGCARPGCGGSSPPPWMDNLMIGFSAVVALFLVGFIVMVWRIK